MAYQTYRQPYNDAEKAAYKAGIAKGKKLAADEANIPQIASGSLDTPASRSAAALERIAKLLDQHWNAYTQGNPD